MLHRKALDGHGQASRGNGFFEGWQKKIPSTRQDENRRMKECEWKSMYQTARKTRWGLGMAVLWRMHLFIIFLSAFCFLFAFAITFNSTEFNATFTLHRLAR